MKLRQPSKPFNYKQWLLLLLSVVALYVLLPQLGAFRHSLAALEKASWPDLLLALIFALLSYLAAAGTYYFLAFHRLIYSRTVLMQFASTFANRLLPAGIGGIGTYYAYLRRSRHSSVQAASVVAANNTLGLVGHMLLLGGLLIAWHAKLPPLHLWHIRQLY
ncbi:MAG: lysylphosphatidylglycerol synthase domain-containing protein, partial [Candidatus Saccharimonadales bacterium]